MSIINISTQNEPKGFEAAVEQYEQGRPLTARQRDKLNPPAPKPHYARRLLALGAVAAVAAFAAPKGAEYLMSQSDSIAANPAHLAEQEAQRDAQAKQHQLETAPHLQTPPVMPNPTDTRAH